MADLNQLAAKLVRQATDPDEPCENAAQINGCAGALKRGKIGAAKLTPGT